MSKSLSILFIVGLIVAGFWLYQTRKDSLKQEQQNATEQATPAAKPELTWLHSIAEGKKQAATSNKKLLVKVGSSG